MRDEKTIRHNVSIINTRLSELLCGLKQIYEMHADDIVMGLLEIASVVATVSDYDRKKFEEFAGTAFDAAKHRREDGTVTPPIKDILN